MFSGSVRDNLFYGLKHRPLDSPAYEGEAAKQRAHYVKEARLSANSDADVDANWIDFASAGVDDLEGLVAKALGILKVLGIEEDVYTMGLYGTVDPDARPEFAARILEARAALRDRVRDPKMASLVELFDSGKYNTNMTVAENILFGTPIDPSFHVERLATNAQVMQVLKDTDLYTDFIKLGRRLAEIMLDLFADVPSDSELFEQFSFISSDDLPAFQSLLKRTSADDVEALSGEDRDMLLSLPFKLIPARHRLGLIDDAFQARLLKAREALGAALGKDNDSVRFFDPEGFNSTISIQDNILFGRLAYGQGQAQARVGELIRETVDALDLREDIIRAGLDYEVGIAGARLSLAQRQKIAIGRCLIKDPDMLIINDATGGLDPSAENRMVEQLISYMQGRGLLWVLGRPELASNFDTILVVDKGRVVEQGPREDVTKAGSSFERLLNAG